MSAGTPNDVGRAIADLKARTGWTWDHLAQSIGTTPTYARKLAAGAGKFGHEGAGRSLAANVERFASTGAPQAPVQRAQRVRAAGGTTRVPEPRRAAPRGSKAFRVERGMFAGPSGGTGRRTFVQAPHRATAAGDREDARNAVTDELRRAAQGRRRVMFRVHTTDGRTITLGAKGGYAASAALAGVNREARDPFEWLASQSYGNASDGSGTRPGEFEPADVEAVEIDAY